MNMTEFIKIEMVKNGSISAAELARRCGWTPQGLNKKFKRGTFMSDDIEAIADALGCDLVVEFKKRTGAGEK